MCLVEVPSFSSQFLSVAAKARIHIIVVMGGRCAVCVDEVITVNDYFTVTGLSGLNLTRKWSCSVPILDRLSPSSAKELGSILPYREYDVFPLGSYD